MKIGILTQPLYCNYGGLVQCYALQETLKRMGHEAVVLQREWNRQYTLKGACTYYAKHLVKMLMGRKESWHYYVAQEKRDYIAKETNKFTETYITPRSEHCYTTEQLKQEVERLHLDAIVVGSDQVWRPYYSPCQPNYFLDFLGSTGSPTANIKRISYAASFGGDNWDWSPDLTAQCAALLQKFDAVSVREQSGIRLCQEHFNVDAIQVLDPTMLLEKEDYIRLFEKFESLKVQKGTNPSNPSNSSNPSNHKRGSLFNYVLDRSEEKQNIIRTIAQKTGKTSFCSMPELDDSIYNLYGDIDKAVYPPVESWLSAFDEAEMVVTDSFHGTVFSIIFNKPFWVVGNEGRGMARFETLLSLYGLQDRMISAKTLNTIDLNAPIDWNIVNDKRAELQVVAIDFLTNAL